MAGSETPVKIYKRDKCCFLCGFDFSSSRTNPIYKISPEGEYFQKIKELFIGSLLEIPTSGSTVSCRGCYNKVNRFVKTLEEIQRFKLSVLQREETVQTSSSSTSSTLAPTVNRVKRCSKSPHQNGPPMKILPPICPKPQTKVTDGKEEQFPRRNHQSREMREDLIKRPLRGLENLPFNDLNDELLKNENTQKKSTVISVSFSTIHSLFSYQTMYQLYCNYYW